MRGSARIYDVRMAQFVLKIKKLSHIMGPRASQDLRSPSLIMAPDITSVWYLGPDRVTLLCMCSTVSEANMSRQTTLGRDGSVMETKVLDFFNYVKGI